jgi:3-oxoacyl-[acyl-carrier protein] reductase
MSNDTLLNWASNPTGRKMMSAVGLPTPQPLVRSQEPWVARPLQDSVVLVFGSETIQSMVAGMGAKVLHEGSDSVDGIVLDARDIDDPSGLKRLYRLLHPTIRSVKKCGRVVVLGSHPDQASSAAGAASRQALIGFVKSVSKELGRKGITANLITVKSDGEGGIEGPLRFLLSSRSAFVTGQNLVVSGETNASDAWVQPLAGKTALVTGAARGIGESTARRLAAEGAKVICLDIPSETDALVQLADTINGVALPLDITDDTAASRIASVGEGAVEIVVHNAGITRDKTLGKMDESLWDLTLEVNLTSVIRITESLLLGGIIPRKGRIVLVSSIAGIAGNTGQTNYAASKAGIVGFTRHLGAQVASKGVAVNAVAPGFIETRLTQAIPFGIREVGRRLSNLNQGGLPLDVAEAITFLSSPGAGGLHGNVLRVCGGNLLGA